MAPVRVSPRHGASRASWTCTPRPRSLTPSRPLPPRRAPSWTRSIPSLAATANRTRSGEESGRRAGVTRQRQRRRGRVGETGIRTRRVVVVIGEIFKPTTCTPRGPFQHHHHHPPRQPEHDPFPAPLRHRRTTPTRLLLPCSDIPSEQRPSPSPHRSNLLSTRTAFLPSSPSTVRRASIANNSRRLPLLRQHRILSHLLRLRGRVLPSRSMDSIRPRSRYG